MTNLLRASRDATPPPVRKLAALWPAPAAPIADAARARSCGSPCRPRRRTACTRRRKFCSRMHSMHRCPSGWGAALARVCSARHSGTAGEVRQRSVAAGGPRKVRVSRSPPPASPTEAPIACCAQRYPAADGGRTAKPPRVVDIGRRARRVAPQRTPRQGNSALLPPRLHCCACFRRSHDVPPPLVPAQLRVAELAAYEANGRVSAARPKGAFSPEVAAEEAGVPPQDPMARLPLAVQQAFLRA